MNVLSLFEREHELRGIHEVERRAALDVLFGDAENFLGLEVDLGDIHVVVQKHDAVGTVLNDLVRHGLRLFAHIRQTHLYFRIAVGDRPCLFAAAVVAARAAVEFVALFRLARAREDFRYLAFARNTVVRTHALIFPRETHAVGRFYFAGNFIFKILVCIFSDRRVGLDRAALVD